MLGTTVGGGEAKNAGSYYGTIGRRMQRAVGMVEWSGRIEQERMQARSRCGCFKGLVGEREIANSVVQIFTFGSLPWILFVTLKAFHIKAQGKRSATLGSRR